MKKSFIGMLAAGTVAAALIIAYIAGICYYKKHFLKGTVIDKIDVSGMSIEEVQEQVKEYSLLLTEKAADGSLLEQKILGKDISLSYTSMEPLQEFLESQNPFLWFVGQENSYQTKELLSYDEKVLEKQIGAFAGLQKSSSAAPTDAYISEYISGIGYEVIPETYGNTLNRKKTLELVKKAVEALDEELHLEDEDCYELPKRTSEDAQLLAALQTLNEYANTCITYTFGENTEVIDGELLSTWLSVNHFQVQLDEEQVAEYVVSLRKKYDTIFRSRNFKTSYGKEVTVNGGDYGWWMDYEKETEELIEMIQNRQSGERTPVYRQTAFSYEKPDYGDSYVEINLSEQHLFLYKEGKLILETDFVSGNSARGYDTPEGVYGITYKQRNATLVGENYATPVDYWMPFNKNIGMHDASWRNIFGGSIYKTNGSHGCINLPPAMAKKIYEHVEKGMAVICYNW